MPVRKVSGGYKVEGSKGTSPTRKAAERKQRAIKANQRSSSTRKK